jgi:hypothetical protein
MSLGEVIGDTEALINLKKLERYAQAFFDFIRFFGVTTISKYDSISRL